MKSVKIGNQEWSSENLNIDHFINGDKIQQAESEKDWLNCLKKKMPAWCYFNNDPENGKVYGKLYNGFAVLDARQIAPEGWHIPTSEEWSELFKHIGDSSISGKLLKSATGWLENGNGIDSFSFNARPGGYRTPSSAKFKYMGEYGFWWSSSNASEVDISIWAYNISNCYDKVDKSGYNPMGGLSIRCVRN